MKNESFAGYRSLGCHPSICKMCVQDLLWLPESILRSHYIDPQLCLVLSRLKTLNSKFAVLASLLTLSLLIFRFRQPFLGDIVAQNIFLNSDKFISRENILSVPYASI